MDKRCIVVLAMVVGVLLAGEVLAYSVDHGSFSIETEVDGSEISYHATAGFPSQLNELHLDNGFDAPRRYMILADLEYASMLDRRSIEISCYFLQKELSKCKSISVTIGDTEDAISMIDSSLSTGVFDTGLVIFSGTIPFELYDGTIGCRLIQWMLAGGTLNWSGEEFGRTYSTHDGIVTVEDGSPVLAALFGGCEFNRPSEAVFGKERINPELTDLSGTYFAETTHGIRIDSIATESMLLGYTDGENASVAFLKTGNGMISLFGGFCTYQNTMYLAHVLSLGLTYSTELVSHDVGSVKKSHGNTFTDSPGITHAIIMHNLKWSAVWVYDRDLDEFV